MCEIKRDKTHCHIDPLLLLLLIIARCVIFKTLLSTFASRLGMLNRRPLKAAALSVALSLTASWLSYRPSLTPTDKHHLHKLFHKAHNFRDCFRLFTQVCLWLTAWLRVNMQQLFSWAYILNFFKSPDWRFWFKITATKSNQIDFKRYINLFKVILGEKIR